jgi:hypothetical protein
MGTGSSTPQYYLKAAPYGGRWPVHKTTPSYNHTIFDRLYSID